MGEEIGYQFITGAFGIYLFFLYRFRVATSDLFDHGLDSGT